MNPVEFPNTDSIVLIAGPAGKLEAVFEVPNAITNFDTIAIVCHPHPLYGGTMQNKVVTTTAKTFQSLGMRTIRFNYRGVGQSEGQYASGIGESADLQAVMEWCCTIQPDIHFVLAGFSFGSFIAANQAHNPRVKCLISIAPPVHHFDFTKIAMPKCPWLVIQGEADEVVPPAEVYRFIEQSAVHIDLVKIPQASHFFHSKLLDLRDAILRWM